MTSYFTAIIESSALSGQRTYHAELEKAIRQYISEHPTEFLPEGVDAATVIAETPVETPLSPILEKAAEETPQNRRTVAERRALQWVLDIFTSAMTLTTQSFGALVDILSDLLESAPDVPDASAGWLNGRTPLFGLVAFLLFMNWWTWSSLSQSRAREQLTRSRWEKMGPGYGAVSGVVVDGAAEKERLAGVATEAVRLFWEGVVERQSLAWKTQLEEEIRALTKTVGALEERLAKLDGASVVATSSSIESLD